MKSKESANVRKESRKSPKQRESNKTPVYENYRQESDQGSGNYGEVPHQEKTTPKITT